MLEYFFKSPLRELLSGLFRSPYPITIKGSHRAWLRPGSSDRLVFDQIFVEREYASLIDWIPGRQIVDLGANCGLSSLWFLLHFPQARVFFVEPDGENFRAATRNLQPFSDRAHGVHCAIWNRDAVVSIRSSTSSRGEEWGRQVADSRESSDVPVRAARLESLLSDAGISRIDLLKVDIEGAEIQLFETRENWLEGVGSIAIELHGDEAVAVVTGVLREQGWAMERSGELHLFRRPCDGHIDVTPL